MSTDRHTLELLAPAKTADFGIEAINHGADAVYIGGPAFGARSSADNSVEDIARLVQHAHRYHAQIFVATNTILFDDELEPARKLIWQLFDAGVDALIVHRENVRMFEARQRNDVRVRHRAIMLAARHPLDQAQRGRGRARCVVDTGMIGMEPGQRLGMA